MSGYGYGNNMSGYGGDTGGGGYMSGSQGAFDSPSNTKGRNNNATLRPVTIMQLNLATHLESENRFQIDNVDIAQVTLIANIHEFSEQSTHDSYRVEDGTGSIDVRKWHGNENDDEPKSELRERVYVRVTGNLNIYQGKRHMTAHLIRPVTDFNEITYHMLEALYVHLTLTKGPLPSRGLLNSAYAPQQITINSDSFGGNKLYQLIYGLIQRENNPSAGISLEYITRSLTSQSQYSAEEIRDTVKEMEGHGQLYTDDNISYRIM